MNRVLKRFLIIFLIIYFLLYFFSPSIKTSAVSPIHERVIVAMVAPIQWGVSTSIQVVKDTISNYFFLVGVKQENKQLNEKISDLKTELTYAKELEAENKRLKDIFNIQAGQSHYKVVAKKIARGSSKFEQTIRIQKGSKHGIRVGMPVLNADGVIGQIVSSYHEYADILLITDPSSSIDVIIQPSRDHAMLKGNARDQLFFDFLSKEATLTQGDVVVTSGLDGIYPQGYPVGLVNAVGTIDHKLFLDASVKPFVNFNNIEEVVVLIPKAKDQL